MQVDVDRIDLQVAVVPQARILDRMNARLRTFLDSKRVLDDKGVLAARLRTCMHDIETKILGSAREIDAPPGVTEWLQGRTLMELVEIQTEVTYQIRRHLLDVVNAI